MSSKINSIVFPNVHEYMYRGMSQNYAPDLLEEWRNIAAGYAEVSILWPGHNKLILAPKQIDRAIIDYHKMQFGYNVETITPEKFTSQTANDFLEDSKSINMINNFTNAYDPIHYITWGGTEGAYSLLAKIEQYKKCISDIPNKSDSWTITEYDSKIGFKKLCYKLQLGTPKGYVCDNLKEAIETIKRFYDASQACVLKANWGAGGFGNLFLTSNLLSKSFAEIEKYIYRNIAELPYFLSEPMLVEELIETSKVTNNLDSDISSGFASAQILLDGSTKIIAGGIDIHNEKGYYEGARMGKGVFPKKLWNELEGIMLKLGAAIAHDGYRGHWGINYMLRKNGEIALIEMNTRRCGESHIHNIAHHIGGDNWMQTHFVLNRFPLDVEIKKENISIDQLLDIFSSLNSDDKKSQIVPVQLSWLWKKRFQGIGYMIIGECEEDVSNKESKMLKSLVDIGIRPYRHKTLI